MATIENLLHRRTDLSTFVVHFTRETTTGEVTTAYDNLMNILRSRKLEARTVYGMARDLAERIPEVADTQRTICFTETPLEHAWMMCADIEGRGIKFPGYGVAFTKAFARRRGANPVWYLDITPGHNWLTNPINSMVKEAKKSASPDGEAELAQADILRLTPFMEQMGPTNSGRKEFWWEREWRHVGDMEFDPAEIVVVFAPEAEHSRLRSDLGGSPGYKAKIQIPALVDAAWGLERMIAALAGVSEPGPFPR